MAERPQKRKHNACSNCRRRKIRCQLGLSKTPHRCRACIDSNEECAYPSERPRKSHKLQSITRRDGPVDGLASTWLAASGMIDDSASDWLAGFENERNTDSSRHEEDRGGAWFRIVRVHPVLTMITRESALNHPRATFIMMVL